MARGTPFVATGEPIMCTMGAAINQIKVTSQQVKKLGGKLQATDADKTPPCKAPAVLVPARLPAESPARRRLPLPAAG